MRPRPPIQENRVQDTCVVMEQSWDEMIAESKALAEQPCTECGKPSGGFRCCHTLGHFLCEQCAHVLEDGYQYCGRHKQDALDDIAERDVYNALVGLHQASLRRRDQAQRCKQLIHNLGTLAHFYMHELKPLDAAEYDEAKDDAE